ncbi:Zinc finger, ring-CH-type [Pochonia chlamydosporia 170]|uniref:Zinc finger, ring-CH-type n=1 Tax=Pochonia chlamydosporia 170 TaxID=1380566 RepID=A0A179G123_METCM|nr:Zinc finger, ring-CH-type [Pochonia chlamydosporia 170]OAQ71033.1 Zinc finger, ring-CH-type [Pochonia chlamydosporia 170]
MDPGPFDNAGFSFERRRMPYATSVPSDGTESARRPDTEPTSTSKPAEEEASTPQAKPKGRRYGPRTCRICLETEHPKFPTDIPRTFGVSTTSSSPVYESDDPELGRLLSPCKCKGSSKYVHEGCLDAWRLTNPTATRNFWQCPTCKFTYRLARLHWASRLSSKWAQIALTVVVIIVSLFILGFIADPILDLWFDPVGSIADTVSSVVSDPDGLRPQIYEEPATWAEHFTKGFFSLGLIGAIKSFVAMGPWHWINFRAGGLFGSGRRGGTGRSRMDNFNLLFVIIGAFTFMMAVWKFVKAMSARILTNVSNKVMDVGDDDDDEDEATRDDGDHGPS